jgi:hypothetical protein
MEMKEIGEVKRKRTLLGLIFDTVNTKQGQKFISPFFKYTCDLSKTV